MVTDEGRGKCVGGNGENDGGEDDHIDIQTFRQISGVRDILMATSESGIRRMGHVARLDDNWWTSLVTNGYLQKKSDQSSDLQKHDTRSWRKCRVVTGDKRSG